MGRAVAAVLSYINSVNNARASNLMTRIVGIFKPAEAPGTTISDMFASVSNFREAASEKALDSGVEFVKGTTRSAKIAAWVGGMGLLAIVVAFCLMVLFAISNASLL